MDPSPEVSFSIYGERGVIDILAWHPGRRALLVIELKTDLVDIKNELLGTFDRKRRLAARMAADEWIEGPVDRLRMAGRSARERTNRRRVVAHEVMLRGALPDDAVMLRRWLRDPVGRIAAFTYWTATRAEGAARLGPFGGCGLSSDP